MDPAGPRPGGRCAPRRPRPALAACLWAVLLAPAALGACGPDDTASGTDAPDRPSATDPTTDPEDATVADRPTADGTLTVRADGARLFLTAAAGDEALVVPDDLSDAEVAPEADGARWSVTIRVPRRTTGSDAEEPSASAVVVQPGDAVEVGPYELGPRPPSSVSLCLEVLAPTTGEAALPTGSEVRIAAPGGEGRYLCGDVALG